MEMCYPSVIPGRLNGHSRLRDDDDIASRGKNSKTTCKTTSTYVRLPQMPILRVASALDESASARAMPAWPAG